MTDPAPSDQTALSAEHVWKVFGSKPERAVELAESGESRSDVLEATGCTIAVRDVSFAVKPGETFVVMGLSGSGKSTLIRCVARLIESTKGTVTVDGEDFTAMNATELREVRRKKLSMVFQHFGLFSHRRVIDNACYGLEIQGVPKAERHERALEILGVVGLSGFEYHYPQQLSGGMQQRVGLARALCVDPEILFFDEPFSALDPLIRRDMQDELIRLQETMKRTIVFITHDFAEAIKLGDRIAIMKDGAFDQVGTAAELIRNPATAYVREFTEDIPKAKVLTARDIMTSGGDSTRRVESSATVYSLVPLLLNDPMPIAVTEDGFVIGQVDRESVATLMDEA
ncbi:MAG: glycine betaine/L-proline ABC transporter ATP-binding protein [Acidimicrobiia bacterium]|nr:glycine betaine/L-proline ABC transporter ATP-binding protein [Acidimicrobiia bacterium]